jgi:hypothetical protein
MLDIFRNKELNEYANEYFLSFFNIIDEGIEEDDYCSAFMDIFPRHLVIAEYKKCKKIYKEIYSWILDEFLHNDLRPIHEYVLFNMLEAQVELEKDRGFGETAEEREEFKILRKLLPEEEREYLDNINSAEFYLDYIFEDEDFLYYKEFYDTFGTKKFYQMRYDNRIIELLPKDKRKELKQRMKENDD